MKTILAVLALVALFAVATAQFAYPTGYSYSYTPYAAKTYVGSSYAGYSPYGYGYSSYGAVPYVYGR